MTAMQATKSVAIIGGGPAGLVAAKTLLSTKPASVFRVTIFEKEDHIGGLWGVQRHETKGFLNAETPTNLSRFTVGFSDLAWHGVPGVRRCDRDRVPMFPKAWQVGLYLHAYVKKFALGEYIRLSTAVTSVSRRCDLGDGKDGWLVRWSDGTTGREAEESFDLVVMASAFFSRPREPSCQMSDEVSSSALKKRIVHSSRLGDLSSLLGSPPPPSSTPGTILIVGGANSSGEIAASLAFQQSSALHSPSRDTPDYQQRKIIHVMPRPLYALLPFVPADEEMTGFVPLDVRLYNLSVRPKGPIKAAFGLSPPEKAEMTHGYMRSMLGGDQSDLGATSLVSDEEQVKIPPYAAITETYSEFVRSKDIEPLTGRLLSLREAPSTSSTPTKLEATLQLPGNETSALDNIEAVVFANGYTTEQTLSILSPSILGSLDHDPSCSRLPLKLHECQTHNPDVPGLGFIGFYEGPYWGVMEMQARMLRERWMSSHLANDNNNAPEEQFEDSSKQEGIRQAMKERNPQVPQYWMADYLGIMEQATDLLASSSSSSSSSGCREDGGFAKAEGPITPARYPDAYSPSPSPFPSADSAAKETVQDLYQTITQSACSNLFMARAAFRALQGRWTMRRRLDSALASSPSGEFVGTAQFHPRHPTDEEFDFEHLYVEEGSFRTEHGIGMAARRQYVYRYAEARDTLSVWFVREDGASADYVFHELDFGGEGAEQGKGRWAAKAEHLCVDDMYRTRYGFSFAGVALDRFEVAHEVKGPAKDYTSTATYSR
ncbi:MAG: hypothetical protein M1828_000017 [Chrysothrix sp. TS-e1954]|nr:MAG: hypothetical protein M1828_000017 [Chrysothrix sp. TS-e1954]